MLNLLRSSESCKISGLDTVTRVLILIFFQFLHQHRILITCSPNHCEFIRSPRHAKLISSSAYQFSALYDVIDRSNGVRYLIERSSGFVKDIKKSAVVCRSAQMNPRSVKKDFASSQGPKYICLPSYNTVLWKISY